MGEKLRSSDVSTATRVPREQLERTRLPTGSGTSRTFDESGGCVGKPGARGQSCRAMLGRPREGAVRGREYANGLCMLHFECLSIAHVRS